MTTKPTTTTRFSYAVLTKAAEVALTWPMTAAVFIEDDGTAVHVDDHQSWYEAGRHG